MSAAATKTAPPSAATPTPAREPAHTSRPQPAPTSPDGGRPGESEADFLARQADEAKAAMLAALGGLRGDLAQATDLRQWARRHPWATVGAAALAGWALAAGWSASRDAAQHRPEPSPPPAEPPHPTAESVGQASAWALAVDLLLGLAKDMLTRFVKSTVQTAGDIRAGRDDGAPEEPRHPQTAAEA